MKFIFTIDMKDAIGLVLLAVVISITILGFIIYCIAIGLENASKKIKKKIRKEEKEEEEEE